MSIQVFDENDNILLADYIISRERTECIYILYLKHTLQIKCQFQFDQY